MLPDGRCVGPIRWDSSGGRTIRTPWLGLLPDRWPTAGPANDLRIGGNKRIRSQLRPIYLKARPSLSALFLGRQTQPRDLASIEAAARSMPHTPPHRHRRRGRTVREGAGGLTNGRGDGESTEAGSSLSGWLDGAVDHHSLTQIVVVMAAGRSGDRSTDGGSIAGPTP
jgi:hypothetical protein